MNGFQVDYAYVGLAVFDQVLLNAALRSHHGELDRNRHVR
jgi:hypothetical protein